MSKSSNEDIHIPSVEQMEMIVSKTSNFLHYIFDCGLINGNPPVGFTIEAMNSRRVMVTSYFLDWSAALNPNNKTSLDNIGISVVDWPNPVEILHTLGDLYEVYFQIMTYWDLARLLGRERLIYTNDSLYDMETGTWQGGQDYSCSKSIPLVWGQQLERVIYQLSNAVNAISNDDAKKSSQQTPLVGRLTPAKEENKKSKGPTVEPGIMKWRIKLEKATNTAKTKCKRDRYEWYKYIKTNNPAVLEHPTNGQIEYAVFVNELQAHRKVKSRKRK